jgi:hypothetical protein
MNAAGSNVGEYNIINRVGCYVSPNGKSVLIAPALGTIGNSGRNNFRDLGFKNRDVSLIKDMKFKERLTAQFRAEFFNVLNHAIFSNPNGPANSGFNGGRVTSGLQAPACSGGSANETWIHPGEVLNSKRTFALIFPVRVDAAPSFHVLHNFSHAFSLYPSPVQASRRVP